MKLVLARRRASNDSFNDIFARQNQRQPIDYLDAAYNHLDENLSLDSDRLKDLTKLRLAHNHLKSFPKLILDLDANIVHLDLSYNNLCDINDMKLWTNGSMLTRLYLQGNKLESLPSCLAMFTRLKVLNLGDDLAGNNLKTLPEFVVNLVNLEELSVVRNNLENFPHHVFALPKLSNLKLARNNIRNIPSDFISQSIRRIDISYNNICELPMNVEYNPSLEYIDLTGNPIQYIPSHLLLEKLRLSCIDCFFNRQTSIELVEEFERPHLKYLALDQAMKQGAVPSFCPLTIQSCFEKTPSMCASCPFRYMHPYGKVIMPGMVQGHYQVPVCSEVCSQTCAMGLIVKKKPDNTLGIASEDLNDI